MEVFTPEDARRESIKVKPEFVFTAFNQLLTEKWHPHSITITQKEAVERLQLVSGICGLTLQTIILRGWLEVEETYRQHGWDVEYDKPGFNEQGQAKFIFKPKK